jgi:hypothetical protein
LAQARQKLGLPPRSANPDDGYTAIVLYADDTEYLGVNGNLASKNIVFPNPQQFAGAIGHAEIDGLNQLYADRLVSGKSGGVGIMYVDRMPCTAYCLTEYGNGAIPKAVSLTGLNGLEIYYVGPDGETARFFILPTDLLWVLGM